MTSIPATVMNVDRQGSEYVVIVRSAMAGIQAPSRHSVSRASRMSGGMSIYGISGSEDCIPPFVV
jgi:hypothetical protein